MSHSYLSQEHDRKRPITPFALISQPALHAQNGDVLTALAKALLLPAAQGVELSLQEDCGPTSLSH